MSTEYYIGAEKVSMSPQGRVIVPQKFRKVISSLESKTLFLVQDVQNGIFAHDSRTPKNGHPTYEMVMDSWGYITLPQNLIGYARLESGRDNVAMLGEGKHFSIVPAQVLDDMWKKTPKEFAELFDGF